MIAITEAAGRQIRRLLDKQGFVHGGLRVGVKAGGCSGLSYTFAWETEPQPDDEVLEAPGGAQVFVDRRSHPFLDGTVLDYDTALISKGFFFQNPKAKATCGCGVSFSV